MFCLDGEGGIVPVGHPDAICLEDLVGYERERGLVLDNLRALLEGRSAANMLLTGDAIPFHPNTISWISPLARRL